MKKGILLLGMMLVVLCFSGCGKSTQKESESSEVPKTEHRVYTRVAASFDYDYIEIHEEPRASSKVIDVLYAPLHGIYSGVLIEKWDEWSQIRQGKTIGYIETKKADFIDWYSGDGDKVVVANRERTPIYGESYGDQDSMPIDDFVEEGTIITDQLEYAGGYYMLITAHDYFYVSENDVKIVDKKDLGEIIR